MDQQSSEMLVTAGMLARNQPHPSGHMSPVLELFAISD